MNNCHIHNNNLNIYDNHDDIDNRNNNYNRQ